MTALLHMTDEDLKAMGIPMVSYRVPSKFRSRFIIIDSSGVMIRCLLGTYYIHMQNFAVLLLAGQNTNYRVTIHGKEAQDRYQRLKTFC